MFRTAVCTLFAFVLCAVVALAEEKGKEVKGKLTKIDTAKMTLTVDGKSYTYTDKTVFQDSKGKAIEKEALAKRATAINEKGRDVTLTVGDKDTVSKCVFAPGKKQ